MAKLPIVTLEEHYLSPHVCAHVDPQILADSFPPIVRKRLLAVDNTRVSEMDIAGVQTQVVSHIPFEAPREVISRANQDLHAATRKHSDRLRAFALVDMRDPTAAASELERCVKNLDFLGALIANHTSDGGFYDTPSFDVFWGKAQELDVPIYLHPTYPSITESEVLYTGPWDKRQALNLGAFCWGWHSSNGLHILRLYAANLFERFPKLKIIIGHMGEMLPFMLDRICTISTHWPGAAERSKTLREIWHANIWVTTSGMFSLAPFKCLADTTAIDHIMYSVDYPLVSHEPGSKFLEQLKKSNLVTDEGYEMIVYKNAARLLKLDV